MCKVTVIVPVYNTEKYLHRCIDSILAQTFTDFELLLINDGSKDNSGAICDEYAAKYSRIKVFHKENGGASAARNMGLDNAKGEWVTFVDSDDYVLPHFLDTFVDLGKYEADLCIQGIILNNKTLNIKDSFDYKGDVRGALLQLISCKMAGSLYNKMFKNSIIRNYNLRLNELFKFKEDEEFLLRYMLLSQNVIASRICGYVYTVPDWRKYNSLNNLETYLSMYRSVIQIYNAKANFVTDFYQVQLCNEWLKMLRNKFHQTIKLLPRILGVIGLRIFRISPIKAFFKKIVEFIRK